jgi:hypothetical protein
VSASASGVVSGGSSNVAWAAADAEAVVVELGPCGGVGLSLSVVEESKSADAGWESTSGRYCEKNWCRRRSGVLSGGWEASAVGPAESVGSGDDNPGGLGTGKGDAAVFCPSVYTWRRRLPFTRVMEGWQCEYLRFAGPGLAEV